MTDRFDYAVNLMSVTPESVLAVGAHLTGTDQPADQQTPSTPALTA